ncbi:helix-turn-helix domain-containing protein [Rhodococcus opacus]|uniref:helix-turn-helix domain-containing protein n=1 Tax=Rhodococcus opacus TaxID=37919 RepID=UPI002263C227|nr:helix-turn-helix domain-containing protein [Rhodococcus opacus]MDX5969952.1 helix-turn-helix domain-containing protein [Rhodococcus opacus]
MRCARPASTRNADQFPNPTPHTSPDPPESGPDGPFEPDIAETSSRAGPSPRSSRSSETPSSRALCDAAGSRVQAAASLGIARSSLYRKLCGIEVDGRFDAVAGMTSAMRQAPTHRTRRRPPRPPRSS